jgi:DeoR/GlpR family transcriptional regulator of sugar metabolism
MEQSVAEDDHQPMFAQERREQIARLVSVRGRVRMSELVARFGVTEPTLRKDLTALEERQVLKRIYGGAIALRTSLESERNTRATRNVEAKNAVARACLEEIQDGDALFFDSGTSVERIAALLAGRKLMVLTNTVHVVELVCELPGVEHVLIGGRYRRVSGSFVGPLTVAYLQRFTVNTAFIGISGLSEAGITVADPDEAALKAAVIERARRVVVPMDASKVGATHFATVCDLDQIDVVVIDDADEDLRAICETHSIALRVAQP